MSRLGVTYREERDGGRFFVRDSVCGLLILSLDEARRVRDELSARIREVGKIVGPVPRTDDDGYEKAPDASSEPHHPV